MKLPRTEFYNRVILTYKYKQYPQTNARSTQNKWKFQCHLIGNKEIIKNFTLKIQYNNRE